MKKIMFSSFCCFWILFSSAQLKIGSNVPDIALPDVNDSIIHLASLQGKVVLIDFWASWCGPCRAANPSVVRLYNKYKSKGFEVFGVSLDSKKSAWLRAIKQDRIKYIQVNDSAGADSKVAEKFGIQQIPTNFLMDKKGAIVAIDKEGKELERLVEKLLR